MGTTSTLQVPRPGPRQSLISAGVFIAAMAVSPAVVASQPGAGGKGLALALILLSLVLLTGWAAGLALQMTFVGIGAYAWGTRPWRIAARRRRGGADGRCCRRGGVDPDGAHPRAVLGVGHPRFRQGMDYIFFAKFSEADGAATRRKGAVRASRRPPTRRSSWSWPSCSPPSESRACAAQGPFGRKLAALNDSPAACATLGVNIHYTKVMGSPCRRLPAGRCALRRAATPGDPNDFLLLISLVLMLTLLIVVATGAGRSWGGHLAFAVPVLQDQFKTLSDLQYLLVGLGAVSIGQYPNGIGG